jgi:hypothetical protein
VPVLVMFRDREAADEALAGDAEAVELGRVVLRVSDSNIARARASFTVPDLPPATYSLMFCDAGCAHPLADVVPTKTFTIVADPATACGVRSPARSVLRTRRILFVSVPQAGKWR